ncbi:hypothetical protein YT1_5515 [Rhodococcus ruber]|nr:hypothetical protein YT1_5515 [Rhodococcus ruber]
MTRSWIVESVVMRAFRCLLVLLSAGASACWYFDDGRA